MSEKTPIYRILFQQDEHTYEVYAKYISEDHLMGFIEIEELIFTQQADALVIDPSEERLRNEFKGVTRSYVPMHSILRIDEMRQEGVAKIKESAAKSGSKVSHLPYAFQKETTE